ncbi:MAG: helix-turn-helix transcriptional regulator [Candidatus Bathyarchaeota archaeon]
MSGICEKLKQLREALGLSQAVLAERAALTAAAICQFENGSRSPSLKTLQQLAKALGVSIADLLENESSNTDQSPEEMALFRGMKNLHKDDKDFMLTVIRALKNQRKQKDNKEK